MIDLRNKKFLLTGGAGFLGSHILAELKNRGVTESQVVIPRSAGGDLRSGDVVRRLVRGCDVIIHAAARVGGIGFNQKHPGVIFFDNAAMALNLIEAAREEGIEKFVGIGTVCEYPKILPLPFSEADIWNGYPEETNAPYGLAKKMMLAMGQAYRTEYGLNAIHLLPANLYGPRDNFNEASSHVIPALIKKVADALRDGADHIEVWGTGKATREFLYVEDAARAVVSAVEKYDEPAPLNIGSSREVSILELTFTICKLMNFKGELRWDTSRPDGQPKRRIDTTRSQKLLGEYAVTDFDEGLRRTVAWYDSHWQSVRQP